VSAPLVPLLSPGPSRPGRFAAERIASARVGEIVSSRSAKPMLAASPAL
jgi:hypothetical protein